MSRVVVTGSAGFIGYHLSQRLLGRGDEVLGIDNLNDYYDVSLKHSRLEILGQEAGFRFVKLLAEFWEGVRYWDMVPHDELLRFVGAPPSQCSRTNLCWYGEGDVTTHSVGNGLSHCVPPVAGQW